MVILDRLEEGILFVNMDLFKGDCSVIDGVRKLDGVNRIADESLARRGKYIYGMEKG